jgi:hypothetical protein
MGRAGAMRLVEALAFARAVRCDSAPGDWPPGCTVQVVPCRLLPGLEFALIAAAQARESRRRGDLRRRSAELDLLLRLLRTDRIEAALAAVRGAGREECCVVAGYGGGACSSVLTRSRSRPRSSGPGATGG